MSRKKFTEEQKIQLARAYVDGKGSYASLAKEIGAGKTSLLRWVAKYREQGEAVYYHQVFSDADVSRFIHRKR